MTSRDTYQRHVQRVLRVVHYLWQHPQQETPLAVLADMAHFSPYHFHRTYVAVMGESVSDTRQRLRLQLAALALRRQPGSPLLQVAQRAGYGSAAAFVRAFRQAYGMPPGRYRQHCVQRLQHLSCLENAMYTPEFRTLNHAIQLAALPHRGDYMQIGQAFERLGAIARPWLGPESRWYGIYLDDPCAVPAEQLRSAACLTLPPGVSLPAGLEAWRIEAGRYVVICHRGPYSELEQAYGWLYGVWLPASGEQLADRPCVEAYLNSPQDTAPKDLLTEIWAPLV